MLVIPKMVAVAVLILAVTVIIGGIRREVTFKLNKAGIFFLLLYVAYAVGTIYTNNSDLASKYLEYKLTFVLFPILLSFRPKEELSLEIPGASLVIGVLILFIMGLINSVFVFREMDHINAFFSANFSYIHHPTYTAVYGIVALENLRYGWKEKWSWISVRSVVPLVVILITFQIMCASLAGLLFLLLYGTVVVLKFVKDRFGLRVFIGMLVLSPILMYLLVKFTPGVNEQLNTTQLYIAEYVEDPAEFIKNKQTYVGGNETRLIMWTAAYLSFREHPMGVGTGNNDAQLSKKLIELGQPAMAEKQYNPHNQFLQTGLEIGWIGLLILLTATVLPIYYGFKYRHGLLIVVGLSLFFNNLFESMLQRQSGIVFYTFLICLLFMVFSYQTENKKE
jgi:O-antigen ligase